MVYIYLSAVYYHRNVDVTIETLLVGGFFRCPGGLSCESLNEYVV